MVLIAMAPMALSQTEGTVHEVVKYDKGPRASAVTWEFEANDYGAWYGHIVNNGLRWLVIDVYDITSGVPEEIMHERIRFAAYPTNEVDTQSIPLAANHKYSVTATPNGPKLSSCTVQDMFRQAIPPTASISIVSIEYLKVTVDGSGSTDDGSIASYAWDFGDGATASGMTASHTYAWDGTYTITLTVTDNDGLTGTASETVTVQHEPMPPVASFTATMDWMVVSVDASASYDPDRWIESYAWDFGDGGSASGVTATHTYAMPGTYTIMLTVTDDEGLTGAASMDVLAREPMPPTASIAVEVNYLEVMVDGSLSSDPDGSIVSWEWDFGDGATASGMTATHTYAADGTYTITLTVTDDDGLTGTDSEIVEVSHMPVPPVASFTATMEWMVLSVDAGASYDPDGSIVSYDWDFGDGGSASGVTATHTYAMPGTYTVTLTVTDNDGLTGTASKSVLAEEEPPLVPPTASFTVVTNYLEVTVDASGSSDSDGSIVSYEWDFGDGSTASGMTATHTYAADGTYTIKLTVTDNDGLTDSESKVVEVAGPDMPPVPDFTITVDGLTVSVDASLSTDDKGIVEYEWNWGDGSPMSYGVTSSHTYTAPSSTLRAPVKASAVGPVPMQPPPPYNVIGYTKDKDGNNLPFCTVTITNMRTSESVVTSSDANAFYMYNLNNLLSGWVVGDVIHVKAEKDTLVGENTGVAEGGAYVWIDVVLMPSGPSPFDVTITLTVTDTGGNKASISKTVTLYP